MKHMRNTCETLTYCATGLRHVYVLLTHMFVNLCRFYVGGKIRPYFVHMHIT